VSAYQWNYEVSQGEDFDHTIWFEDERGIWTDLTGSSFRAALKVGRTVESEEIASFTCTVVDHPDGATTKNPVVTNRALNITLASTITDDLEPGSYYFELWTTDALGRKSPVLAGVWKVQARGLR
jgi:hypothetical protein